MARTDPAEENQVNEQLWPMGAVTRRTGIGEHTLRAWERRFGFPSPKRLPSGHRRYTGDQVRQLMLINTALANGYRAGDVVALEREQLERLLEECGVLETAPAPASGSWLEHALGACRRFDREALHAVLQRDAATLGVPAYLRSRIEPLLVEVGDAWARGDIDVRHEHFCSEVLEDQLRGLRAALQGGAGGRPVVLACLPGEHHDLGLQVAALAIAAHDRAVRALGPNLPAAEIAAAAAAVDAAAVGLSVSANADLAITAELVADLRRGLTESIPVWLGGAGSVRFRELPRGVTVVASLDALDAALATLPS